MVLPFRQERVLGDTDCDYAKDADSAYKLGEPKFGLS